MLVLWFLQVFFLNNFYEVMKVHQTEQVSKSIENAYANSGSDTFQKKVLAISDANDMYIYISSADGNTTIFSPSTDGGQRNSYVEEMSSVKERLLGKNLKSVSIRLTSPETGRRTLAWGTILTDSTTEYAIAYIFSPLFPVSSTLKILTNQLIYVTIISLILAFLLSFYLSNRITRPIRAITKSASRLGQGEYGIVFKGGYYTEISNLADTLTRTSIELEKSDMLQKDLIANVSHDLKTPLTMVKSYAEMIRDLSGDNPSKRQAHLQVIIDEADRLNILVSDMLTISKMQSNAIILNKEDFNLTTDVKNILTTYALMEETEGYHIQLNCKENLIVNGDPEKTKQVFYNLLNNGLKFCGDDKTVVVNIKRKGRKVLCQVIDHGVGIHPDELPHIWERYYKASSNMVRSTTGTGLGLSIIKEILTLQKSDYGVHSTLGEGTTFWFELNLVHKL